MPVVLLSAVIISYNEEANIERCLESLVDVVDEIVVVDSFSTDKTVELCRKFNVTLLQHPFSGHIEQKNYALNQAQGTFVLSLDADEALSSRLQSSITALRTAGFQHDVYTVNRLTHYVDRWIKHCGWYPDRKIRLARRTHVKWGGTNPHDKLLPTAGSRAAHLQGDLLHYSYPSIADHVTQTNKFTTIAAEALFAAGTRSSTFKIITRPLIQFGRDYFFKLGFLDGRYGFVVCYINGLSALLKYSKLKQLQDNGNKS